MWINTGLLVGVVIYVIIRDKISKRKRERDTLAKKRISCKLDRIERKIDNQTKLFDKLLDALIEKED